MLSLWSHTLGGICYSWFYHTWLITCLWNSMSLCRLFRPHGLILYFDVPRKSPKNTCLCVYSTFKDILTCICIFWAKTHVYQEMCINPKVFRFFPIDSWITWLLAFHILWERLDLTLHCIFGVLYIDPLGYIEGGQIGEQGNYSPLLLHISYTWVYIPLFLLST